MVETGEDASGDAHHEAVGRSRFRLSFTVAVLQLAVALAGVGVALLVGQWNNGASKSVRQTIYKSSQIANAARAGAGSQSEGHTANAGRAGGSQGITRSSGHPAPAGPGGPGGELNGSSADSSAYGAGWPAGFVGYTVALASDVIWSDAVGAVAKARSGGLGHVGVLRSDRYGSLRPGYWFVFSGVYATAEAAQRYVPAAVAAGFSDAYARRIAE